MKQSHDEFCQKVGPWSVFFSSEYEGFYAMHVNGREIGYVDSEAEILEEIDADDRERNAANRGPFAYLN